MAVLRWGLIVEEARGRYNGYYQPRVVGEVTGTREEALARLEEAVTDYVDGAGHTTARRRLYRTEDGFHYVHGDGRLTTGMRFSVAELISDSNDAKEAAAAEKRAAKERKAAARKARREQRLMPIEDGIEDGVEDDVVGDVVGD